MTKTLPFFLICSIFLPASILSANQIAGKVLDPAAAPVAGAQVAAMNRLGVVARTTTDSSGAFRFDVDEKNLDNLVISAPGFQTVTVPPKPEMAVTLTMAPVVDSVTVAGSTIEAPLSQQGSSVSILNRAEIESSNEASALDLLRYMPGLAVVQTGTRGGITGLYVRGGDPDFNLVEIDGVPVNTFGGDFDFSYIPADSLQSVEVVRGAESAVYGPYAIGSVVNFVTRAPQTSSNLELVAEGGTYAERRFGIGGGDTLAGFGISAFAGRMDTDGPVPNGDYHNENIGLNVLRNFGTQSLSFHGNFIASANGVPGPYGSNPAGLFPGIDLVSRNKNNFSDYGVHYQADLSPKIRQELFGTFFLNNNQFISPYPDAFNKDIRVQAESRTLFSLCSRDTLAAGVVVGREEVKNSYVTGSDGSWFLLPRTEEGIYVENRLQVAANWFLNTGVRTEVIDTHSIPAGDYGVRPAIPANTIVKVNPKVASVYRLRKGGEIFGATTVHGSFGTGIRPPSAFDIAFTDNPALKPERTISMDSGIEQRLFHDRVSVGTTYFYNRYYDLIVSLGGSLANLSTFLSDNLANSRAQGLETEVRFRPNRMVFITGNYTYLDSEVLSLNGSSTLVQTYYRLGMPLLRRPQNSGAVTSTFQYRKVTANVTGYFRGQVLDVEPNYGISAGIYPNPGYADVGVNLNYAVSKRVTLYANLRNILNQYYEEALGYPALKFNFVSGVRIKLGANR
jgi:outer membrane cobalamin receptor